MPLVMDKSKPEAFDRVAHKHLLKKRDHYGVRVSTKGLKPSSPTEPSKCKLYALPPTASQLSPQGTVDFLEPLLFLLFINDLPDCVQSSIRLFADDCILHRRIRDDKDAEIIQEDMNQLA